MRVFECCMYYDEAMAAAIKIAESSRWVDELHVLESDRTFKDAPKPFTFSLAHPCLHFHRHFEPKVDRFIRRLRGRKLTAWGREAQQREACSARIDPAAGDIVVLSDIDEIIDSRLAEPIIDAARKHGIISVRLHFTLFYLNVVSLNWHDVWPGSAPDYAYRVFVMTGEHFNRLRGNTHSLRTRGQSGQLATEVPLFEGFAGFHHSWLGDASYVGRKIAAYAHRLDEHIPEIARPDGTVDTDCVDRLMRQGRSIFAHHELSVVAPATRGFFLRSVEDWTLPFAPRFLVG